MVQRSLACCALLLTTAALAVPVPAFRGYVVDDAHIIDTQSAMQISMIASAIDHDGIAQLAVCTVPDLGDESKEEFAVEVFKKWGLGHNKQRSDGVLVLLVPGQPGHRKIKVEVGYGLEGILPDGKVGQMIRDNAVPHMANNEYGPAAAAMITALAGAIRADASAGGDSAPKATDPRGGSGVEMDPRAWHGSRGPGGDAASPHGLTIVAAAMFLLLLVQIASASKQRFPGVPSALAAAGLTAASIAALLIFGGLVAWLVFGVGALGNFVAYTAVRSHKCPKCGGWLEVERRTVREPTRLSAGLREVSERCTRCDYRRDHEESIARLSTPVVYVGGGGGSDWGGGGGGWGGGGGGGDSGGGFSGGGGGESGGGGAGADV